MLWGGRTGWWKYATVSPARSSLHGRSHCMQPAVPSPGPGFSTHWPSAALSAAATSRLARCIARGDIVPLRAWSGIPSAQRERWSVSHFLLSSRAL